MYIVSPKWASCQYGDLYWTKATSSLFDFGQEELPSSGLGFWPVKRLGLCFNDRKLSVMVFQDMLQEEQNTEDINNTPLLAFHRATVKIKLAYGGVCPSQSSVALQKSKCHCPPQLGSGEKSQSRHRSNAGQPVSQEDSSTFGSDKDL